MNIAMIVTPTHTMAAGTLRMNVEFSGNKGIEFLNLTIAGCSVHRMVVVHGCSTTQCKLQFIIVFAIADVQIHYDIQIGYRERIWSVNYVINFSKVARCFGSKWAFLSCNCFVPCN